MSDESDSNGNGANPRPKIIDFSSAKSKDKSKDKLKDRKASDRTTSLPWGASRSGASAGQQGYDRALAKQKQKKGQPGGSLWGGGGSGLKWFHYLQVIVFLVLIVMFMRSCETTPGG